MLLPWAPSLALLHGPSQPNEHVHDAPYFISESPGAELTRPQASTALLSAITQGVSSNERFSKSMTFHVSMQTRLIGCLPPLRLLA